jgi:hypothetical protein
MHPLPVFSAGAALETFSFISFVKHPKLQSDKK